MHRKCQWKCDDVKNCVEVLCWSQRSFEILPFSFSGCMA